MPTIHNSAPCLTRLCSSPFCQYLNIGLLLIGYLLVATTAFGATSNTATYIGRTACKSCHAQEDKLWQGSPHDRAMQTATETTVLGDFNNLIFSHSGIKTTFFRHNKKFMVRTDGPDGQLHDYTIQYTFGFYPLQQYLIAFPGGRLQVLDIAWDSRPRQAGGQRWFQLHPDETITAGDILHWTGPNLNWNYMCADCHSTGLKKNLDNATGTYHTHWSAMDVSCEACHGPGSRHQKWAQAKARGDNIKMINKGLTVALSEADSSHWSIDKYSGKPVRSSPNTTHTEIKVCAPCHSRRSQLNDTFTPGQNWLDSYQPALLTDGLYYADGQIHDEVYVWGSFVQSKMYHAGVSCSDCHDPHSTRRKAKGAKVCLQCHQAKKYTSTKHHFHQHKAADPDCIRCHMPAKTYMGVDIRHDHSFRIPRPDLSISTGSPNTCNQCHKDKTAQWSVQQLKKWYGKIPIGYQRFATTLAAARQQQPGAENLLIKLAENTRQPLIARATAIRYLSSSKRQNMLPLQQALNADEPLLRLGALEALQATPVAQHILAFPLVWDKIRPVRIMAARLMAAYPRTNIKPAQAKVLDKAIAEYIQVQLFNGERPESQVNLGGLYADMKQDKKAAAAYEKAIRLQAKFVPAYIGYAQLFASRNQENRAAEILQQGLKQLPDSADLHYALGLSQIRRKAMKQALASLKKATDLASTNSHYAYVYAVALQADGQLEQALTLLRKTARQHPYNTEVLGTLISFNYNAGNHQAALNYARKLQRLQPENSRLAKWIVKLKQE